MSNYVVKKNYMKKHITQHTVVAALIGLIIGGGIGFESTRLMPGARGVRTGQFQAGGMMNRVRGGFTAGEVLTKDATSMTVKAPDGSSKIVLTASSTQVTTSAPGTLDDVVVGTNVLVTGPVNSDQSVTAQNIQIRPAGTTGPRQ
jgi:hypothetical protein